VYEEGTLGESAGRLLRDSLEMGWEAVKGTRKIALRHSEKVFNHTFPTTMDVSAEMEKQQGQKQQQKQKSKLKVKSSCVLV